MVKRQEGLTIYPDANLLKKIKKGAEKQKRSMNNFVLFLVASALEAKYILGKIPVKEDKNGSN